MIGAEAQAELAQRAARRLVEALHLLGDAGALQHAERFGDLEGDAAHDALEPLAGLELEQHAEVLLDVLRQPEVEPALDGLERRAGQVFVGDDAGAGLQQLVAGRELGHGVAEPADRAVVGEREALVDRRGEPLGPGLDLAAERLQGRGIQRLGGLARRPAGRA